MLTRTNIALLCILGMMGGFIISPALCSISVIIFGINALWGTHPRDWVRNKWWLIGVIWMAVFALSWFWSLDKHTWGIRFQVKLAILVLPVAFAYIPRFSARQLQLITFFIGLFLFAGACYSVSFIIIDPVHYLEGYRVSHLLPTPCGKDHVRFSLAISLYIVWSIYAWPFLTLKTARWFVGSFSLLLAVYLHVLAAKNGLLSLYFFLAAYGLYMTIARRKLTGLFFIAAIPIIIFGAIKFLPTFGARLQYMNATWYMFQHGDKTGRFGDIGRLMSYDIAVKLITRDPLIGVGAGDMLASMKKGYDEWYPLVDEPSRLLPHNQFLTIALGCGIPAMLVFLIWTVWPLTWVKKDRKGFFLTIAWAILFFQLLIEPVLEVQYGVFVYLFFVLLFHLDLPELPATSD